TLGAPVAMPPAAYAITPASPHPPAAEPCKRSCGPTTIWPPTGTGAEPQVEATVARTTLPCCSSQLCATSSASPSTAAGLCGAMTFIDLPRYEIGASRRRTRCAGIDPCFDQRTKLGLRAGRRDATGAWVPTPTDERIFGHMVDEFIHRLAAVSLGILDLLANLAQRLAHPRHLDRREMPLGMARQPRRVEVLRPVARRAAHADGAEAVDAANNERQMRMPIIALRGTIACRVA